MIVEFTQIPAVTKFDRDAMFSLMDDHFEDMQRSRFERDLCDKNWVVLVKDQSNVVGFTTIRLSITQLFSGDALVIYSGDTLVNPKYRMATNFVRGWFASMHQLKQLYPELPLYWFLLCSGFRTYRFMPVYWKTFYPRHDLPTPPEWKNNMDYLAETQFGTEYNKRTGIVKLLHPQVLRESIRDIPEGRADNRNVRFFAHHNPGHALGDELVCLTQICRDNLTRVGQRFWDSPDLSFRVIQNEPDL
jgi:hypothetical protein